MGFPGGIKGLEFSVVTAAAWAPSLAPEFLHAVSSVKKKKKAKEGAPLICDSTGMEKELG